MSESKPILSVQVTEDIMRRVDAFARREERTRSWAARELIERSLRRARISDKESAKAS